MTAIQMIVKEAKKLKKQYPKKYKTWTEYVKQASVIYNKKNKAKSPTVKKKKAISGVKKKTVKKSTPKSYHKDSKSHNVRISVMSGTTKANFNMLKTWQNVYGKLGVEYISTTNIKERRKIKKEMQTVKEIISDIKKLKSF